MLEGVAQAFCFGPKRKFLGEVQTVDKKGLVAVVKIPDFPTNPKSSKALNLSRVYQARFAEEVPDSCFFFQENKSSLPLVVPVGKRVAIVRWQDPKGLALRTAKLSLDQSIRTVAFHPTSRLVAVGTGSVVKLVDYKNAALPTLQSYTGHDGEIMALAFSSDGKCLVSGSTDGTVRIWPQDAPNAKPSVVDFKSPVLSLAFSPDGTTLALGLANSEIHLLGTQTWQKREKAFFTPIPPNRGDKKQVEREKVVQLAYYSNGNRIVVAGDNGSLLSFNSKLEDRKRITQSGSYFGAKVSTTPDGAEFVIIAGSSVIFQKLEEKEVGYRHPTHAADVIDLAFTPDGKRLVSIGKDNHLTFWNPARIPKTKEGRASKNSQPVAQTDGKVLSFQTKGRPTCVRFDPRGHFLVLGFEDGSLQFWDGTPNNVARQD